MSPILTRVQRHSQIQTRGRTRSSQVQTRSKTRLQLKSIPNLSIKEKKKKGILLKCLSCDKTYRQPRFLNQHQQNVHFETQSIERSVSPSARIGNVLTSANIATVPVAPSVCSFCGDLFDNLDILERHKAVIHAGFVDEAEWPVTAPPIIPMDVCGGVNSPTVSTHVCCSFCGGRFDNFATLQRHTAVTHTGFVNEVEWSIFPTGVYGQDGSLSIATNMWNVSAADPFMHGTSSVQYSGGFYYQSNIPRSLLPLEAHEPHEAVYHTAFVNNAEDPGISTVYEAHTGFTQNDAEYPGLSMEDRNKVRAGKRRDDNSSSRPKSYPCVWPGCKILLSRESDLNRHYSAVHQGLRKFSCSDCSYASAFKTNVTKHELTHLVPMHQRKERRCPFWEKDGCEFVTRSIYHESTIGKHLKRKH